jgi:membrane protease YdiL (CAAX protease family)
VSAELWAAFARVAPFAVALGFLGIAWKRGKINRVTAALRRPPVPVHFAAWCAGFLLFIITTEWLLGRFGLLEIEPWSHSLLPSLIRILGAVVLAPAVEELVLRGVLLGKLAEKLNIHLSILIQAAVFVLLHSFTYESSLASRIATVQAFTDGILYGYARRQTQSLLTPIAMHMTGNLIATVERFLV